MSSNHSRDPDAIDAWVYLYQRSILRAQGMGVLKVKIKPAGENHLWIIKTRRPPTNIYKSITLRKTNWEKLQDSRGSDFWACKT